MSLPDDWTYDEHDELDLDEERFELHEIVLDGGPNPDDARDLVIDDELLDHLPSRAIEDVDVSGDLL